MQEQERQKGNATASQAGQGRAPGWIITSVIISPIGHFVREENC